MSKEYFKVIPAVYLILEKDSQVLLLKRANTGYMDGWYSLPAGHHDGGETLKEAACREAREEVGLDLKPQNLEFVHVIHRAAVDGERIDFFFRCSEWRGEPINAEPEKCSSLDWIAIDNLPENIIPEVRSALIGSQKGAFYSEQFFR